MPTEQDDQKLAEQIKQDLQALADKWRPILEDPLLQELVKAGKVDINPLLPELIKLFPPLPNSR
jgi:hypothetical protein